MVMRLNRQDKVHVLEVFSHAMRLFPKEPIERHLWIIEEDRIRIRSWRHGSISGYSLLFRTQFPLPRHSERSARRPFGKAQRRRGIHSNTSFYISCEVRVKFFLQLFTLQNIIPQRCGRSLMESPGLFWWAKAQPELVLWPFRKPARLYATWEKNSNLYVAIRLTTLM